MKLTNTLAIAATFAVSNGFSHSPQPVSRREAVSKTLASIVAVSVPGAANAINACPPGSNNCLRQTWTPPPGTSARDAAAQLRDVLSSYPQGGLEDGKVDGGGYTVVSDTPESISLEYRSSGKGTFARLFNGGKPFVDDLIIETSGDSFEVRSSSRVGDSDFGVNGKRLSYLFAELKGKGWSGIGLAN